MTSPNLRELPDSIETERLLIRSPRPGDGAEVNAAIRESLDSLQKWMSWALRVPSVQESEERCRRVREAFLKRTDLPFHLYLKGTDTFVGASGLHPQDWEVPKFHIGYWCRKSFEGQGYITEAVLGITRFGFEVLDAQRIEICCDPNNIRSRRVAERAGYCLEAELRNARRTTDGKLGNTLVFAMLPEEWKSRRSSRPPTGEHESLNQQ